MEVTNLVSGVGPILLEYTSQRSIEDEFFQKNVNNILEYEVGNRLLNIKGKSQSDVSGIETSRNPFDIIPIDKKNYYDDRNYSTVSYSWTGYVTSISKGIVKAILRDSNRNTAVKEEAEFRLQDLDSEDARMIEVGSVFYWSIGYTFRNGTKRKVSFIRLKRLPSFSPEQIDKALDWARDIDSKLNWD